MEIAVVSGVRPVFMTNSLLPQLRHHSHSHGPPKNSESRPNNFRRQCSTRLATCMFWMGQRLVRSRKAAMKRRQSPIAENAMGTTYCKTTRKAGDGTNCQEISSLNEATTKQNIHHSNLFFDFISTAFVKQDGVWIAKNQDASSTISLACFRRQCSRRSQTYDFLRRLRIL
jgi:hypothetical protein